MQVKKINKKDYKDWLLIKHYAKRLCSISYAYGLYFDNELKGVCTFGMPPSSTLAKSICGDRYKKNVLELNRLVIDEGLGKNVLSFFVSKSIKMLPENKIIVSFADANQNHNGYIYQATNFLYTGLSSNTSKLVDKFGVEFHFRNIGHHQKNNKLNAKLIKRRVNEHLINRVDIANFLRENKKGYSNKKLSELTNVKVSKLEHWFRTDKGFSFPSIDDWKTLKKILILPVIYDKEMLDYKLVPCATDIKNKLELKEVKIKPKHRYIIFKGSKTFKQKAKKELRLNTLEYPKGINSRYLIGSFDKQKQLSIFDA